MYSQLHAFLIACFLAFSSNTFSNETVLKYISITTIQLFQLSVIIINYKLYYLLLQVVVNS